MNKHFTLLLLLLSPLLLAGQTVPQWQWAGLGKASAESYTNDICTDLAGNVYVTGFFQDSLVFPYDTFVSKGGKDFFLAKYSSTGQFLWAKCGGGIWTDQGTGLATDKYGNVYVGSSFEDTAIFGADTFRTKGWSDIVLTKYDSSGNRIWAKTWGSIYPDDGIKIFIDKNSNIFLTGMFAGDGASPPSYGTIDFDNLTLTSSGGGDIFIVKLDSNATVKWAKHAGGKFGDGPSDIAVDGQGYIYITGYFDAPWADFANKRIYSKVGPFNDMFVAQYDSTGYPLWVKGAGGDYPTAGAALAVDASGNSYVTGTGLATNTKFDNNIVLSGAGSFIAKYNFSGNLLWAQRIQTVGTGFSSDIVLDAENNFYTTGYFINMLIYNNDTLSTPGDNVFVVKYNSNGDPIWAKEPGGVGSRGSAIALDNSGNILVGGTASASGTFFGPSYIHPDITGILTAKLNSTTDVQNIHSAPAQIVVYPDPANDILHVVSNGSGYNNLWLYDLLGHIVYEQASIQKETLLDVRKLATGFYYLTLSGKANSVTQKIIIQH